MNRSLRVVIDTNVWVSALLRADSVPGQAVRLARSRDAVLMTHDALQELDGVLRRPKFLRYLDAEDRDAFLAALVREVELVEPGAQIRCCRDPRDDKFLEAAVWGGAACIVTGDDDLLALDPFGSVAVLTPAQFLVR